MLCELRGYDLDAIETPIRERIAWVMRQLDQRRRLAGTVANEHLTAIMAHDMLTRRETLKNANPQVVDLWLWHGIEETEHKSVAFDVFVAVGGTTSERRRALIFSTWFFLKDTLRTTRLMLRKDGRLWSLREWVSGLNFLFVYPGVLRRIFVPFLRFLRKDFYPWQHDNRYLIDEWSQQQQVVRHPSPPGRAA